MKVYGVFDRITINASSLHRLKDDVIKMLVRAEKFGVMPMGSEKEVEPEKNEKEEKTQEADETIDV